SFTIAPNTASQVAFGTQPTTTEAGKAIAAITALVQDQYGNTVTTSSADVTVAVATGPTGAADMTGTATATASSGVATFSTLTLTTAGAYTLGAAADGLSPGTSNSFTVTATTASKLAIGQGPTDA